MITANVKNKYTGKVEREYRGRSLREIYRQMCADLRVEGPRGLLAATDDGAEIACSLYYGESYIRAKDGRIIWRG